MEKLIRDMIEKAEYYYFKIDRIDEAYELMRFTRELIDKFAETINCPSNWRSIGEELAEEYDEDTWTYEQLELWNHKEE